LRRDTSTRAPSLTPSDWESPTTARFDGHTVGNADARATQHPTTKSPFDQAARLPAERLIHEEAQQSKRSADDLAKAERIKFEAMERRLADAVDENARLSLTV
jgi:hypothetical protein